MNESDSGRSTASPDDSGRAIELLSKVGFSMTGAAYVFGVLIANVHLSTLGFPPPELVQSRYLLVGALWLALVGSTLATTMWAWSAFARRWKAGGWSNRTYGVGFALSLLMLSVAGILKIGSNGSLRFTSVRLWLVAILICAAAGEVWICIKSAVALNARSRATDELRIYSIRHYTYQIVWALLSFYVLTYVYARVAYPELISSIGGGSGRSVLLVAATDKSGVMRHLHLPERPDGLFGPVELVAEDSNTYYVVNRVGGHTSPIRLMKHTCEGVLSDIN